MLIVAIVAITLALVLYSVGVWGEKLKKTLKPWHVGVFWAGFVCDTVGTTVMGTLANSPNMFNFHGITGAAAILLMLFHAVWATVVICRKDEAQMRTFHRLSLVVWVIWLVPYFSGMIVGMGR